MSTHYGDFNAKGYIVGKEIYVGVSSSDPSGLRFPYPVDDSEENKLLRVKLENGLKKVEFSELTAESPITVTNNPSGFNFSLDNSGVTAGVYGSGSFIPIVTVNNQGIVTSITTESVSGGAGDLSLYTLITDTAAISAGLQTQINNKIDSGAGLAGLWNNVIVNSDGIVTSGAYFDYSKTGPVEKNIETVVSSLTLSTHYTTLVDATSANVDVSLPLASTISDVGKGTIYVIKRVDGTGNTVTVLRTGADTFFTTTANVTGFTLLEGESVTMQSDGISNRWVLI